MAEKAYTEARLKNMSINPEVKGLMTEVYPDLTALMQDCELPEGIEVDAFLRYLAYAYHPESPLTLKHADLKVRKRAAGELAGFKPWHEHAPVIVRFLKMVNESEWTVIVSLERMFDEVVELINQPIDTKGDDFLKAVERKMKLKSDLRPLLAEIREAKRDFFGRDEALEKAATVSARTPEDRARMQG